MIDLRETTPSSPDPATDAILERAEQAVLHVGERLLVERLHQLLDQQGSAVLVSLADTLLPLIQSFVRALPHVITNGASPLALDTARTLGTAIQERGIPLSDLMAEGLLIHERLLQGIAAELRTSDHALVEAVVRISRAILLIERTILLAYQESATATLLHLAHSDSLTRLANRRYFEQRFADELQRARRTGRPLAIVLIDMDGLKSTNDSRGHAAGDALLRAFAALLQSQLRAIDLAARLGGDEFALLLPDTDEAGARVLVNRLRESARDRDIEQVPLRFSAGSAIYPRDGETVDALLKRADDVLYDAKRNRPT